MSRVAIALALIAFFAVGSALAGSFTVRNCYTYSTVDIHSFNSSDSIRFIAYEVASGVRFQEERTLGCSTNECVAKVYISKPPVSSGGMGSVASGSVSVIDFVVSMAGGPFCFQHVDDGIYTLSRYSCAC